MVVPMAVAPALLPHATAADAPIGGGRLGSGSIVVGTGPDVAALPRIGATTWVLADATTGDVLAARAAHSKRPPASTLKTLTALTLIPRLDPAGRYTVVDADVRVSGSRVGLLVGERYTHDQLFKGLMLPSGNDAAGALARANGGMTKTMAQMNAEADRLGARDTTVKNPSGLDAPGQVSSAYDLALIAREGLKNPDFARYASMTTSAFPGKSRSGGARDSFQIQTQNPLLKSGYSGAIGVKTGFTSKAGRTFVAAATRGDRTLIVAMMGINEPTKNASARLLDWGFANGERIDRPVGLLVEPGAATAPTKRPPLAESSDGTAAAAERGIRVPDVFAIGLTGAVLLLGAGMVGAAALTSRRPDTDT
jgi:D-alanyl-D-alanine carboxypeptidase (penicillin-binding protein 5/6)